MAVVVVKDSNKITIEGLKQDYNYHHFDDHTVVVVVVVVDDDDDDDVKH